MDSVDLEKKHHHHYHHHSPPPSHRRHLPPPPHHHQHHHHQFSYISPHCPHHSYLLRQKNHSQSCPFFISRFSEPFAFVQSQTHANFQVSECNETHNNSLMTQDEIKKPEPEEEEEEEEEPIFVLTDEWKEFFAKSEARRRLAKKQAKKKGKA